MENVETSRSSTLAALQSVGDGRYGETLDIIWKIEPNRRVLSSGLLPEMILGGFDPPERLVACLDAVGLSAVTRADVKALTASSRQSINKGWRP